MRPALALLLALAASPAGAQGFAVVENPAEGATQRESWGRAMRDADRIQRGSPLYDPGNPAFYRDAPWMAQLTLRRCAQRIPGATPSPAACRAARTAAEGR